MHLKTSTHYVIHQLIELLETISEENYIKPVNCLNLNSIGQHVRHIVEFFLCLSDNYETGLINYDSRKHDKFIETDKFLAIDCLRIISDFISETSGNKPLFLVVNYSSEETSAIEIPSNYQRELAYNLEHAIHHMAIIKIGLKEIFPSLILPPDFGVAGSTLRYLQKQ